MPIEGTTESFALAASADTEIGDIGAIKTSITPGTSNTHLGKLVSAAHNSAHTDNTGVMTLAVRNDGLATLVDTDHDYAPFQVDANGALYISKPIYTVSGSTLYTHGGTSVNWSTGLSGSVTLAAGTFSTTIDCQQTTSSAAGVTYPTLTVFGYGSDADNFRVHFAYSETDADTTAGNWIIDPQYAAVIDVGDYKYFKMSFEHCPFRYVKLYISNAQIQKPKISYVLSI